MHTDVCFYDGISLEGVRGILIDIDGTLYPYSSCHEAGLLGAYVEYSFGYSWDEFSLKYRSARDSVTVRLEGQGACRSRFFAFQMMCEEAKVACAYSVAKRLDERYWHEFIMRIELNSGAEVFLRRCAELRLPVCAVTDMLAGVQVDKLSKLGVGKYINYLVTSEEVGAEKPAPIIFETALNKLNLNSSEVIMIGDDFSKDILGAENLGIRAIQVRLE